MSTEPMMGAAEAAAILGGKLRGGDAAFSGVSTDSRHIQKGELFVALKGAYFDGHAYLAQALARGAAAALVSQKMEVALPQIVVSDTRLALGKLAQNWRQRFSLPVLALTGSNGKTTVKEMLRNILTVHTGAAENVLATEGNLNNDIGLPLTLLRLRPQHRYAVLEMGMNHMGEISYLTQLAEPDVALVTMAGSAHIGELGSHQAIAQAKGEIYAGLKPGGIAVINMQDRFGAYWRELAAQHRIVAFGIALEDDVHGTYALDSQTIAYHNEHIEVRLGLAGEHNQRNALAAAAGACALDVPLADIKRGLESFQGVSGRLRTFLGHHSATIIDDTYNASPESTKAAIGVLAARPAPRILVLGDMGELGIDALALHREIGRLAVASGIDELFAIGEFSKEAARAFGPTARHFENIETLTAALLPRAVAGVSVLVKGSRFMKMERVVEKLVPAYTGANH